MLVSYSHRFIFIHTGKTGGMSMRAILQSFATEPDKFRIRRPPKLIGDRPNPMYGVWETLLLHAKASDVQKELPEDVFKTFYKFAFVRNPWDLQVSMYHFILREPTAPRHAEVKALGSFDAFIEWVIATSDPYPRGISKLQGKMITDSYGKLLVDFVGHYETLEEDFTHVCRALRIDAALPHLNRSEHDDYRSYYSERTRKLIGEHFQSDIELFDYTFDGYRGTRTKEVSV
jgi:hypothetical protein